MIKAFIINNYLAREFIKVIINMSLAFFCLGFIINLFEEINFFKDFDVGINVPIMLSTLFVPSMTYNMFPFVIWNLVFFKNKKDGRNYCYESFRNVKFLSDYDPKYCINNLRCLFYSVS